ncbi:MAG: helix-turn-helix domain-containing protein [Dehalococcoidia bacterium]
MLGPSEMRIFDVLAQERGRVLTWDELGKRVYGEPSPETRRLLRVHVSHIRQKLGNDCIVTVRGIGFRCGWQDVRRHSPPSDEG